MLWTHAPLAENDRWALANAIVDSGCRYAVCGGAESEALHDEVDSAYIRPIVEFRPEGENRALVMTTWHEGEAAVDVASFFVRSALREDGSAFSEYVVVHVGGSTAEQAVVDAAVREREFCDPAL